MTDLWFDAHLDLAYLAVNRRDMLAATRAASEPHAPAAVTLPELAAARVRLALATIFTEADGKGPEGYPAGDAERAHAVGRAQMEVYQTWQDRGAIGLDLRRVLWSPPGVGKVRGGMGVSEVKPPSLDEKVASLPSRPPLHVGVLVENADPIRSPDELPWWRDRGVVAIGLAWVRASRYAGGNSTESGLTSLGRDMIGAMDDLGLVHDLSHLSDRAMDDLLSRTDSPVIASHSNCRALIDRVNQRHLRDEAIREIGRRGGVVGLNLYSPLLVPNMPHEGDGRATIDDAVRHVERVCELMGHQGGVGLGSDMDGGFSAARLPVGIDSPRDLPKLAAALAARGWREEEVEGFMWRNWCRFWAEVAPEPSGLGM